MDVVMGTKTHRIRTVQDMIDCTNEENLDRFIEDVKSFLTTAHAMKQTADFIGGLNGLSEEERRITCDYFDWQDDGKKSISIKLKPKK